MHPAGDHGAPLPQLAIETVGLTRRFGTLVAVDHVSLHLPRLAIRPYPSHCWKLRDGTPVTIRPIRPEDGPLLVEFHRTLSEHSVYYWYFEPAPARSTHR